MGVSIMVLVMLAFIYYLYSLAVYTLRVRCMQRRIRVLVCARAIISEAVAVQPDFLSATAALLARRLFIYSNYSIHSHTFRTMCPVASTMRPKRTHCALRHWNAERQREKKALAITIAVDRFQSQEQLSSFKLKGKHRIIIHASFLFYIFAFH